MRTPQLEPGAAVDDEVRSLLDAIYERFHYDFRGYARGSLERRLSQAVTSLGCATLGELRARLLGEPEIFSSLLRYLTVQVSDLFRDPGFFRTLREDIVPVLATYPSLKIWVAGCATGEEVLSVAILLREENLLERSLIYATDIHLEALRTARRAVYPATRLMAFNENHALAGGRVPLTRYYAADYGAMLFDRALLKRVVFSDHCLATDSVFAEVQLVLCRNVLMYFGRELQRRALRLFDESLCRRGFLGLGTRETAGVSDPAAAFERCSKTEQWYRKR